MNDERKRTAMNRTCMKTVVGEITIAEHDGAITNLWFGRSEVPDEAAECETDLLGEAQRQLDAYFRGELREFSLPLAPAGTPFMQRVWAELRRIPYGATASYKQIAEATGNPKAARAVGLANNRNPIPIIIPCHRVIASNGTLAGYRSGAEIKQQLLDIERKFRL